MVIKSMLDLIFYLINNWKQIAGEITADCIYNIYLIYSQFILKDWINGTLNQKYFSLLISPININSLNILKLVMNFH